MSKKMIRLSRDELVWQTRTNYFGEQEWNEYIKSCARMVEFYKEKADKDEYYKHMAFQEEQIYNIIKDITWEQVLEDYSKDYDDHMEIHYQREIYDYSKGGYTGEYEDDSISLYDLIVDTIREDNYQCDIDNEDYADDYQEDWSIVDEVCN